MTSPDGEQWITLLSFPDWRQQHPPEVKAIRPPTLNTWMQLHAYMVPLDSAERLKTWAIGKDWFGLWMPQISEPANLLLGSHPTDPLWATAAGESTDWDFHNGGSQPTDFINCGASYSGTGTDRDASAADETHGFVPSLKLFDVLDLQPGVDFVWRNQAGVAVFDPSTTYADRPNTLLVRRSQLPNISEAGFTLFWTVLIGQDRSPAGLGLPKDDYRWVDASASYILQNSRIEKTHSQASQYSIGRIKEFNIDWQPRTTEF